MTDLSLQVSLRWFEITLGQLLRVTKENMSQTSLRKPLFKIIRLLFMSPLKSQETLNVN